MHQGMALSVHYLVFLIGKLDQNSAFYQCPCYTITNYLVGRATMFDRRYQRSLSHGLTKTRRADGPGDGSPAHARL